MRFCILILLLLSSLAGHSQGPANNWYFGGGAGITFNTSPPTALNDGKLYTLEGCASISNDNGQLLFYTDGRVVYNRNGDIMENGTGLMGDQSSSQSAIIIPQPLSTTIYYIFTVDVLRFDDQNNIASNGVNYSIVDFSENPDGVVTSKNNRLLNYSAEKLSAVIKGCDSDTVWMVTLSSESTRLPLNIDSAENLNTFYAYAVTPDGIDLLPVVSKTNIEVYDRRGNLKFSPNGTKLAAAHAISGLHLLDFDAESGRISNPIWIPMNSSDFAPYGVEFSPNSELLYVHSSNDGDPNAPASFHTSSLFQYDISNPNINSTQVLLDAQNYYRGSLQLGPDGKIYRALSRGYQDGLPNLGVIDNPNARGTASNYIDKAINLGHRVSFQGLPPFNQSLFNKIDIIRNNESNTELHLCSDETYELSYDQVSGASYSWYRNSARLPGENGASLTVRAPGNVNFPHTDTYELIVDLNDGSCEKTGVAEVNFYAYAPQPSTPIRLVQCQDGTTATGFSIFNLDEIIPQLTGNDQSYTVTFHESNAQANTNTIPLEPFGYRNISPSQRLYARVSNLADCVTIIPVELVVSTTRAFNAIIERCDEDLNGFMSFDLREANDQLLEGQSSAIEISYYSTIEGALLEDPVYLMADIFENTTAYDQVVYARLENNNACFAVSEIQLIVQKRPEFEFVTQWVYCTNTFPQTITIEPDFVPEPGRSYTYEWAPEGQTTRNLVTNLSGTHTLTITDAATKCETSRSLDITEHDLAIIESINVTDGATQNSAVINISGRGEFEFSLDPTGPFQDNNNFTGLVPGFYTVYVRSKSNCGMTTRQFSVIGFPEFFTPNGDGQNDLWQIKGIDKENKPTQGVRIFDRYGKLLKELDPLSPGWDGTFNGKPLPSDDYWFHIILQDGRDFKSHFSLIR